MAKGLDDLKGLGTSDKGQNRAIYCGMPVKVKKKEN
jgi:hypothetical protein